MDSTIGLSGQLTALNPNAVDNGERGESKSARATKRRVRYEDEDAGIREMAAAQHKVHWKKGTRLAEGADLRLTTKEGEVIAISLEPLIRFQMLAIGSRSSRSRSSR